MKLHLVDGTFELFRSFFGAPKATGRDGRQVGATRGLVRSMSVLLSERDVTHVGIAFDHVIESFRNQLFEGYKTGLGLDPDLYGQFELAERAAAALGLVVWPMVDFEADDAIATAAARWSGDVEQVVICSPDKDLAQCVVGDAIICRDRMRKKQLNEAGVIGKFGVPPASIPDYLALVGDTADGIPGLPRWGARSTAAVLARYGHIEAVPADAADWDIKVRGAASLATILRDNLDDALLFRTLATLRVDVPLTETLDALAWRGPDFEALKAIADELGDPRLLDRVPTAESAAGSGVQ